MSASLLSAFAFSTLGFISGFGVGLVAVIVTVAFVADKADLKEVILEVRNKKVEEKKVEEEKKEEGEV